MSADYIYRNGDDSKRFRILQGWGSKQREWNVDVFVRGGKMTSTHEDALTFPRKRDALAWIRKHHGEVQSINPKTVTEGWDAPPKKSGTLTQKGAYPTWYKAYGQS